ncbi:MAG: DUF624 domain-containing protein [Lachnospirales bacterium]
MNEDKNNAFFNFILTLGDLILLNILFIIFSLPIITIGASCCSLYSVIKQIHFKTDSYLTKEFLAEFKNNFKNSTIIWIVFLTSLIPLRLLSYCFVNNFDNFLFLVIYIFIFIYFLFTLIYVFPLQATFSNTPFNIIKNSLITALKHLPYTIILCVTTYSPFAITWLLPQYLYITFIYWILIGFSITTYCSVIVTTQIFKEYID